MSLSVVAILLLNVMEVYSVCYLLIKEFESWSTGVYSPYVVSLCDFAYYVFR